MQWVASSDAPAREGTVDNGAGPYILVVRGPDGRPRCERFSDAAVYRARLVALQHAGEGTFSIEEIAGLFDT
jgi:hypothetical protein